MFKKISRILKWVVIFLVLLFCVLPVDLHYNENTEVLEPFYIYNSNYWLVFHFLFLLFLIMYFYVTNKYFKNSAGVLSFVISIFYFLFSIFHQNSMSWRVMASPFMSLFLILLSINLILEYIIKYENQKS